MTKDKAGSLALTLAVALAGALVASLAGVPLPWLTGPMAAVAAAAISGLPMHIPATWRGPVFVVLGMSMGAGVTPEGLEQATAWPVSFLALAVAVPAMAAAAMFAVSRMAGWDKASALLAVMPGALSYVMAVAIEIGADARRVAVVQTLRLVVLVLVLPSFIIAIDGGGVPGLPGGDRIDWVEMIWLGALCALAGYAFNRIGLPAGLLFGPMLVSAIFHGVGLAHTRPAPIILNPGMLLLGALIGARFAGISFDVFRSALAAGVINIVIASAVAFFFAALVTWAVGIPIGQTMMAFAPGGAEAMALMAFVLDLDPAYVAIHHVARFLGLGLLLPVVMRAMGITGKAQPGQRQDGETG